ncbi:hypothetical protein ROZALSC1DRAFT_26907 [Rozella allomycis CSF55]|uniref:F-BAR domain-containing protein n=1 Tax=Rozella allomycis (strain CSF55) TaxID=988480 RepID=A0A075AWJ6_ROZAC|nr:hypothetical protein O9G_001788 [Rozella allomycis CSF55]RKP21705.1 hypothetical protein ROZALSC1DRAFT_26907 [Rozella allomycis CSF55]|eukprot:EPZ34532.1 hypothetical protein O9G_001788 [Rozella allomycis CSF55]
MSFQFSESFWGNNEDGYKAIRSWLKGIKISSLEFQNFISQSTTRNATETFLLEFERIANSHAKFAQDLKEIVQQPLNEWSLDQSKERKKCKEIMKNTLKNKQNYEMIALKCEEKYHYHCKDFDTLQSSKIGLSGKDYEKLENKIRKAQQLKEESEKEYRVAITKAQDSYHVWRNGTKEALEKLQQLEELRLNQLKVNLMLISNISASVHSSNTMSYDVVRQSLEKCAASKDLDLFIEQFGTGNVIPDALHFKDYYVHSPHTIEDNISIMTIKSGNYVENGTPTSEKSENKLSSFFTKKSPPKQIVEELWVAPDEDILPQIDPNDTNL